MDKRKVTTRDIKEKARRNDPTAMRIVLSDSLHNALLDYKATKEDHRYFQGRLQALEDLNDLITKQ